MAERAKHVDVTVGVDAGMVDIDLDWLHEDGAEAESEGLTLRAASRFGLSLTISKRTAAELHRRLGAYLKGRSR